MREQSEELRQHDIKVAVVTFEAGLAARGYAEETGIEWPILVDENRQLYHAYGMLETGFWDLWGITTWKAYFKELLRGRRLKKSTGDIRQRGGDVLIDPQGIVRLHHIGSGPADRPGIEEIINACRN